MHACPYHFPCKVAVQPVCDGSHYEECCDNSACSRVLPEPCCTQKARVAKSAWDECVYCRALSTSSSEHHTPQYLYSQACLITVICQGKPMHGGS